MRLVTILSIFGFYCLLISCGSKPGTSGPGVVLVTQPMIADVGGATVGEVVKGSAVECIGFSPDSSTVKISVNGEAGWVPRATVALNARPGIGLRYSTLYEGGLPMDNAITEGTIVGIDTVVNDMSHVLFVRGNQLFSYWVKTADISTDPKDIALIIGVEELSKLPVAEHSSAYRKLLEENAGGYFVRTFKVNLSEAPDTTVTNLQERLSIALNKSDNTVTVPISSVNEILREFFNDLAGNVHAEEVESDPDPRHNYFYHYICQLPSFVKIGPRYEFASYEYINATRAGIAYLLFRLDRSPENLQVVWDSYKTQVMPLVNSQLARYVEELITVHDHIFGIPDYKGRCAEISGKVAAWEKGKDTFVWSVGEQQDFYEPILHSATMEKYPDMENFARPYWLHSFWVRRVAEGNADVVYNILKEISQNPDFKSGGTTASQGEKTGPKTLTCTFRDVGLGDCWHVEFDCGDYGDADTSQLDADSQALWESLSVADANGDGVANPEYVGKQFIMKVGTTRGSACNEGQGGEGDVPLLLEFRLAGN